MRERKAYGKYLPNKCYNIAYKLLLTEEERQRQRPHFHEKITTVESLTGTWSISRARAGAAKRRPVLALCERIYGHLLPAFPRAVRARPSTRRPSSSASNLTRGISMYPYPHKAGKLEVGRSVRSGGKIFDEWSFSSPFDGHNGRPKPPVLKVEIAVHKSGDEGITFEARSKGLKQSLRNSDIEVLRQAVEEELRFHHHMLTEIPWEDWLEIKVSGELEGGTQWKGATAGVKLEYFRLQRAVNPQTGGVYVVNKNNIAVDFPKPKKAGERDPEDVDYMGMRIHNRDVNSEYSYLPATPENLAALNDLQNRIEELRLRMSAFLNQGTVQESLANVANGMLSLPAPL